MILDQQDRKIGAQLHSMRAARPGNRILELEVLVTASLRERSLLIAAPIEIQRTAIQVEGGQVGHGIGFGGGSRPEGEINLLGREAQLVQHGWAERVRPHQPENARRSALLRVGIRQRVGIRKQIRTARVIAVGVADEHGVVGEVVICSRRPFAAQILADVVAAEVPPVDLALSTHRVNGGGRTSRPSADRDRALGTGRLDVAQSPQHQVAVCVVQSLQGRKAGGRRKAQCGYGGHAVKVIPLGSRKEEQFVLDHRSAETKTKNVFHELGRRLKFA